MCDIVGERVVDLDVLICIVDIREIQEIREGINSKDFERSPGELEKIDQQCCFIVYYGMEFKLKSLSVAGTEMNSCGIVFVSVVQLVSLLVYFAEPESESVEYQ